MAANDDLDLTLQRVFDALVELGRYLEREAQPFYQAMRPVIRWWRSYSTDSVLPAKHGARYHGSRVRR